MKHFLKITALSVVAISCFGVNPAQANCNSSDCKSLTHGSDNYIGVAGKNGPQNFGVISKFKIVNLDKNGVASVSFRPEVYFDQHDVNPRGTLTLDLKATDRLRPFVGAGIDYNTLDHEIQPVITGGADIKATKDFTITTKVNYLTDTDDFEFIGGVGYNF